jgi:hypothetical protein
MSITPAAAYQLLRGAGFTSAQAVTLTAVGQAESGLDPNAIGDVALETSKWGPSVGIWQIRTLKAETGKGTTRDLRALKGNPTAQARAARAIFQSQGLHAWSTYTSGAYRSHLPAAKRAAGSSPAAGVAIDPGPALATPAGLNLPDLSELNPLNWPGAIAHGFGDAAGDAVTAPARLLWSVMQPFFLTTLFAGAGIGIILIGAATLTKPVRDQVEEKTQQATAAAGPLLMAV